jgi:VIT1/CCC1 family predicted Fe2+/Mn2+ transporter
VILLGTLQGILVAIVVSLVALAYQVSDPPVYVLGRKPGTNAFRPRTDAHPDDEHFPGLLLLRPQGRLFFANAHRVGQKVLAFVIEATPQVVAFDLSGVSTSSTPLKMLTEAGRYREQGKAALVRGLNPDASRFNARRWGPHSAARGRSSTSRRPLPAMSRRTNGRAAAAAGGRSRRAARSPAGTQEGGMPIDALAGRERLLNPIDRSAEILFGLIMAVTILGSLSIAKAGSNEVRTVMATALGCNLAWGLVDAVMYLVRTLTERAHLRHLAKRVIAADTSSAHHLIRHALPASFVTITGSVELEGMRRRLLAHPIPAGVVLGRRDYLAAVGVFLLVVLATFPVVVPFLLTHDVSLAMSISRAVTLLMLLIVGWTLGRYAGYVSPALTGVFMVLLGVALIAVVKVLGG